ncbi:MAG: carboxypeptidase regulatory-like domain-containing protein [Acidobacteria bacterium]|nr:carboxypeptidase regulatory-like domain-containing protein [Acidobacteriota bacterium]
MRRWMCAMLLGVALCATAACQLLEHSEPAAPAPTGLRHNLSGTIFNLAEGPIAAATLTVVSGSDAGTRAASDAAGRYAFTGLSSGRFTVTIEAPGYERATPIVDLTRDLSVDFALRRAP